MTEKRTDIWMPLYVGEYLADTMALTTEQHGAYCLMLMACWKNDGRIAADDESLVGITKLPIATLKKYRAKLVAFFEIDGDDLVHGRVVRERERAVRVSAERVLAGKKSAEARQRKKDDEASKAAAIAAAIARTTVATKPETVTVTVTVPPSTATPRAATSAARFADFWNEWPATDRKVNRKGCLDKWRAKALDGKADAIVEHVVAMKATRKWLEGFEPRPDTYLAQELWNDGVPDARVAPTLNDKGEVRAWHEHASGITAKGEEHGLRQADFPHFPAFKAAVYHAAGFQPSRGH